MGLFDLFKKKKAKNEIAEMASKVREQAFPGGNKQIMDLVNQQYEELNHRYSKDVISEVINYIGIGIIMFQDKSAHRIVEVGLRPKNLVNNEDGLHIYKAVVRNMFENKFGGYNEAGFNAFYETLGNIEGIQVNDTMPGAYGEYGDLSNPIPINGIVNSYAYLDRLRLPNGAKVKYERIGSFSSDITDQIIDGYVLSKEDGTELATIYICPYVNASPQKAPKGFVLA